MSTDWIGALDQRIKDYICGFEENLFTAMPGFVQSYNPDNQEADIVPALSILFRDRTTREFPVVKNVPVQFPGTKTSNLNMPISAGDSILVVFSQRSLDKWQAQNKDGRRVNPEAFRKHELTDAIAIPGIWPTILNPTRKRTLPGDPSTDVILSNNLGTGEEAHINIKQNGDVEVTNPTGKRITLKINGDIEAEGENLIANFTGTATVHSDGAMSFTSDTSIGITAPTVSVYGTVFTEFDCDGALDIHSDVSVDITAPRIDLN